MHYIHNIDPIAFYLFDIPFAWYWLSYLAGLLVTIFYGHHLIVKLHSPLKTFDYWQHLQWGWPALFIGARFIYIIFYNFSFFWENPQYIPQIWLGGMSFHGALLGIGISALIVSRKQKSSFFSYTDIIATVAPIGIFLGRISNFINGELAGRPSDLPWAVIFPRLYDNTPRHPSQLYEAFGEGILLFIILRLSLRRNIHTPGIQTAFFLSGYGFIRFFIEFFRLPDSQLGTFLGLSMGQYLCLVMILTGVIVYKKRVGYSPLK